MFEHILSASGRTLSESALARNGVAAWLVLGLWGCEADTFPLGPGAAVQADCALDQWRWTARAPLLLPRFDHTLSTLPDGRWVAIGGFNGRELGAIEVYDPAVNTWSMAPPLVSARYRHTTTLLATGDLLVVGGQGPGAEQVERISVDGASQSIGTIPRRFRHTASRLADGRVFIVGGSDGGQQRTDSWLFDPIDNSLKPGPNLRGPRSAHAAILDQEGNLWVVGGQGLDLTSTLDSVEIYVTAQNRWREGPPLLQSRAEHTISLVDGGILVTGGFSGPVLGSTEFFALGSTDWVSQAPLLAARNGHHAVTLCDGSAAILGGFEGASPLASVERWSGGAWTPLPSLREGRARAGVAGLSNGELIVTGGSQRGALGSVEQFALPISP